MHISNSKKPQPVSEPMTKIQMFRKSSLHLVEIIHSFVFKHAFSLQGCGATILISIDIREYHHPAG